MRRAGSMIFIGWSLFLVANSYAQNIPIESYNLPVLLEKDNLAQINSLELIAVQPDAILLRVIKKHNNAGCRAVFRTLYNKPRVDEKTMIRQEWRKAFGIDLWQPYYTIKDVERQIKEKLSIKIFKLKGVLEFGREQFFYIFKTKF